MGRERGEDFSEGERGRRREGEAEEEVSGTSRSRRRLQSMLGSNVSTAEPDPQPGLQDP